jgi:hypothetical protein
VVVHILQDSIPQLRCSHFFLEFISGFNRHYSFNGMTRVHRQRGVNDDFINLEDLSNQLFGCAHRDTVASVCS